MLRGDRCATCIRGATLDLCAMDARAQWPGCRARADNRRPLGLSVDRRNRADRRLDRHRRGVRYPGTAGGSARSPGTWSAPRSGMIDTLDVLQILASQHSEVDELFEKLESGKGDRAALFAQLADKLAAHAAVEEKIFYPAVMATQTSDLLHESVEEHLAIKRLIADMLDLDPSDDQDAFDAKLSVLKENVSHHAHAEEEAELFPKVRNLLGADDRAAIGNDVLALFESLIEQSPRFQVPEETAEAAPLPSV
jgi:hemerythrin superfamily protein